MRIHAYTSFTYCYLNRARVFAATLRKYHPDWVIWAVLCDKEPEGFDIDWATEDFDRVLTVEDLLGERADSWMFGMDVVEACTAIKGVAMKRILAEDDCQKLLYFDPDIALFNPVDNIVDALEEFSIVLTPHQIDFEQKDDKAAILDNEICSLIHGVFNLGFIAIRNDKEGIRFSEWWADRLFDWCYDEKNIGLFVDQKWCDLVPCFFDNVLVLRDPGCNVASWNISQRKMTFDKDGMALVNGKILRFFHFTKLGAVGDMMTMRYAKDNIEIYELWRWYRDAVVSNTDPRIPNKYWHYGFFDNGVKIPKTARKLYRDRSDLRNNFKNPFHVDNGYYGWLEAEAQILKEEKSASEVI